MKKEKDPLHAFLRSLGERGGVIPPFAMELVLIDGMFYYVHSVERAAGDSLSISIRIWDTRQFDDKELARLRKAVAGLSDPAKLADPKRLHPALDWGTLRVDLDRISYCVEWHHALWPVDRKKATHSRLH
jgi:hypothetical protein